MSETSASIARREQGQRGDDDGREAFLLPRWALELLRAAARIIFRLLWRMRYVSTEHIPPAGPLIIAANHQTYFDPFWLSVPVKRQIRYLAWDVSFGWPVVGTVMRWLGAWPLQIEKGDPRAIRRSLQWLRDGGALVIFPEGGRAYSEGDMHKFKAGAARIALEAGAPVLPVTIRGGHKVWPRGRRWPRLRGRVEIIYHPLRRVQLLPGEDARACARRETEELARIIGDAL
ncbi:MAG TPA: lysophospholipid acyltransferase family protein [Pyrinomonadaceae bacterium]